MVSATYLIIGSGETGLTLAEELIKTGKGVILVDQSQFGGTYLNNLDYPKYLLTKESEAFASSLQLFKDHPDTFSVIRKYRQKIHSKLGLEIKKLRNHRLADLEKQKQFRFLEGKAQFFSKSLVEVNSEKERHLIAFKQCILATGKNILNKPELDGLGDIDLLHQHNIFLFEEIPSRLGIWGCTKENLEVASIYSGLGVRVSIFEEKSPKDILPEIDRTALNHLVKSLNSRQVEFFFDTKLKQVKKVGKQILLTDTKREEYKLSHLFVTLEETFSGEDLNLNKIGLKSTKYGIKVSGGYKTKQKDILTFGSSVEKIKPADKSALLYAYLKTQIKVDKKDENFNLFDFQNLLTSGISFLGVEVNLVRTFSPVINIGYSESKAVSNFGTYIRTKIYSNHFYEGLMKVIYKQNNGEVVGIVLTGEFAQKMENFGILALKKSVKKAFLDTYMQSYWGI